MWIEEETSKHRVTNSQHTVTSGGHTCGRTGALCSMRRLQEIRYLHYFVGAAVLRQRSVGLPTMCTLYYEVAAAVVWQFYAIV